LQWLAEARWLEVFPTWSFPDSRAQYQLRRKNTTHILLSDTHPLLHSAALNLIKTTRLMKAPGLPPSWRGLPTAV
jgi:hypothetical protein